MAPWLDTSCLPDPPPPACLTHYPTLLQCPPPTHRDDPVPLPCCINPYCLQGSYFLLRNLSPTFWKQWILRCSGIFIITSCLEHLCSLSSSPLQIQSRELKGNFRIALFGLKLENQSVLNRKMKPSSSQSARAMNSYSFFSPTSYQSLSILLSLHLF